MSSIDAQCLSCDVLSLLELDAHAFVREYVMVSSQQQLVHGLSISPGYAYLGQDRHAQSFDFVGVDGDAYDGRIFAELRWECEHTLECEDGWGTGNVCDLPRDFDDGRTHLIENLSPGTEDVWRGARGASLANCESCLV